MADYNWDDSTRWADDSKCIVCGADLGKSLVTVCSATCEDILLLAGRRDYYEPEENDCYA